MLSKKTAQVSDNYQSDFLDVEKQADQDMGNFSGCYTKKCGIAESFMGIFNVANEIPARVGSD